MLYNALVVAEVFDESQTETVKPSVPIVVGVPVIAPVEEFRLRPAGRDPDTT
jgi:hypothetical protein